jgi:hypothetical protein
MKLCSSIVPENDCVEFVIFKKEEDVDLGFMISFSCFSFFILVVMGLNYFSHQNYGG